MLIDSWEGGVARQQKREESYQVSHLGLIVLRKKSTLQTNMVIGGGLCWGVWGTYQSWAAITGLLAVKGKIESYAEL